MEFELHFRFFAQRRGIGFLGNFPVHRRLQQLPSRSLCNDFVALVNQSVRHDIGGQHDHGQQERRPDIEQDERTRQTVQQEEAERRSQQDFSEPVTAAVENAAERPSRQDARG